MGSGIAYVGDSTGENELYLRPQDGRGSPVQLTSGADTYYFTPEWSPDSLKLAWGDRAQRLRFVDIATKAVTLVEKNPAEEYDQYAWSPDSQWIAYTQHVDFGKDGLRLYSLVAKKSYAATESWFEADSPRFSDDGKFLLFSSSRDFHPIYSDTEWNHAYQNMQRVYLLALARDVESPLKPTSDEVAVAKDGAKPAETKEDKPSPPPGPVRVDLEGLTDRVIGLPVTPANYGSLRMIGDSVYYLRTRRAFRPTKARRTTRRRGRSPSTT